MWANYALAAYKGVHDYLAAHPDAQTATSKANPGLKVRCHPASCLHSLVAVLAGRRRLLKAPG